MIQNIFLIFVPAVFWAIVNHIDKHLVEKYCKNQNVGALMIFSSLIGIPVSLLMLLFDQDVFSIQFDQATLMILSGVIYIFALIPYLYALEIEETSRVAPLMLLTPVFSIFISWMILGEVLTISQSFSILVILAGAYVLNHKSKKLFDWKINYKIIFLMSLYCLLIALNIVLFKYNNLETTFTSNVFWTHIGFGISGLIMILIPSYRNSFLQMISANKFSIWTINIVSEVLTIAGNLSLLYISLLFPVSLVLSVVEGIQPLFVFMIGTLGTIFLPKYINEDLNKNQLLKKLLGILIMFFGFLFL